MMHRNLLVLDLDETLMHASERQFEGAQFFTGQYFMAVRPGLEEFLAQVSLNYDLLIWSNNGLEYINHVLENIWPENAIEQIDIFTSADCARLVQDGMATPHYKTIKSICKLHKAYSIDPIIGIDDKPAVYARNYGNLVAVTPYRGGQDSELELLAGYLTWLADKPSLRAVEKRGWQGVAKRLARESVCQPRTSEIAPRN